MKLFISLLVLILGNCSIVSAQLAPADSLNFMKNVAIIAAQNGEYSITSKDPALKIGLGLGYRFNLSSLSDPYIAQTDTTLQFQKFPSSAFVISATLIFQLGKREDHNVLKIENGRAHIYSAKSYNRIKKDDGVSYRAVTGEAEETTKSPWVIMASLNLVDIDNNSASFNKAIDGGLGIGYRISDVLNVGLFGEYTNARQLRSYIKNNFTGKPIIINNEKISTLNTNDNNFFYNKPVISLAIKLVVALGVKPDPEL